MLTLRKLMLNTPSDVVARSRESKARVISTQIRKSRGLDTFYCIVRVIAATPSNPRPETYDVHVELFPSEMKLNVFEKISYETLSWVKCSCPYFLFHCEYALAKAGSSEIDYSNGKRPQVKNPREVPYLCKHLYRAAPEVISKAVQQAAKEKKIKFV